MKISPRPDYSSQRDSSGVTQPSPCRADIARFLYRGDLSGLFHIVPAVGSFGKDYGPDLAVWLATRRPSASSTIALIGRHLRLFGGGKGRLDNGIGLLEAEPAHSLSRFPLP